MICYIPECICYDSENFGLGSLRDEYVGLAGATPQFYPVAPYRFDYRFVDLFVFLPLQPIVVVFSQPGSGLWPPRLRGFMITHNDVPQSVGHLWTSDQSVAENSDNTQHSQQKNIHAPGGIRTHNLSRRAAVDLRLRPRGHWDRCFVD